MSIGSRIKDLREEKGLSRPELANLLDVTVGSISNYENGVSSPKEPVLFKIIETLGCDANYLFQDVVKIKGRENDVTLAEYEKIKKYRILDEHGKKMVDFTLDEEHKRSAAIFNKNKTEKNKDHSDHLTPVAAHNETASDPEQQRLMKEDLDEL